MRPGSNDVVCLGETKFKNPKVKENVGWNLEKEGGAFFACVDAPPLLTVYTYYLTVLPTSTISL